MTLTATQQATAAAFKAQFDASPFDTDVAMTRYANGRKVLHSTLKALERAGLVKLTGTTGPAWIGGPLHTEITIYWVG